MIRILQDAGALADTAAETVVDLACRSIVARGAFRLGLSGGATPRRLYERLAAPPLRGRIDVARIDFLFADERAVPPDHPDSNYAMVRALLLDPLAIAPVRIHRMRGEADDLEQAALDYEPLLAEPLDLLILGIGEDGHTASLFPRSPALRETTRRVVVVLDSPKPPPRRLTITPRVIAEARHVMMLASGASKAQAVALALEGAPTDEVPAALARDRDWFIDRALASRLRPASP